MGRRKYEKAYSGDYMQIKEKVARTMADMMSEDQKKDAIQKFYEVNKARPEIETLLKNIKEMLKYDKDDVPKR